MLCTISLKENKRANVCLTIVTHNKAETQVSLKRRERFLMRKDSDYQGVKFMNLYASDDIVVK